MKRFKLNLHHLYGMAFVALGAAVTNLNAIKGLVSDRTFGLMTMGLGVGVAAFGYLKGNSDSDDAKGG